MVRVEDMVGPVALRLSGVAEHTGMLTYTDLAVLLRTIPRGYQTANRRGIPPPPAPRPPLLAQAATRGLTASFIQGQAPVLAVLQPAASGVFLT